jgi:hypothetical protein
MKNLHAFIISPCTINSTYFVVIHFIFLVMCGKNYKLWSSSLHNFPFILLQSLFLCPFILLSPSTDRVIIIYSVFELNGKGIPQTYCALNIFQNVILSSCCLSPISHLNFLLYQMACELSLGYCLL